MRAALLVGVLVSGGCLRPDLVDCGNGVTCSPDRVCDLTHGSCVAQEQLDACADLPANDPCLAIGVVGACYDGVCLPTGCGNGVVDEGEVCDEGDVVSGDGCRSDCLSDETCGNGIVDLDTELCDDNNTVAFDGCSDACATETIAWSVLPLAPHCDAGAFDEARARYVCITRDSTWELDGEWQLVAPTAPPGELAAYYDTTAAQVRVVMLDGAGTHGWDGAMWNEISAGIPEQRVSLVVFDQTAGQAVAVEATTGSTWELTGSTWAAGPALDYSLQPDYVATGPMTVRGVYDPGTNQLVVYGARGESYSCPSDDCSFYGNVRRTWRRTSGEWARTIMCEEDYFGTCFDTQPPSGTLVSDGERIVATTTENAFVEGQRVRLRSVGTDGIIRTVPGTDLLDVFPSETLAPISGPDGALYVAGRSAGRIWRIDAAGNTTTIAGVGMAGSTGDGGLAVNARVAPLDVVFDAAGNLLFSEIGRIRKIDTAGVVTTIAGNGTQGEDGDGGLAIDALLTYPDSLALGPDGSLYLTSFSKVRRIRPDGIIVTVAGNGSSGTPVNGGLATSQPLRYADDIAVDSMGRLYITDQQGYRLYRVDAGVIQTIAGNGQFRFDTSGVPATSTGLGPISTVAVDAAGNTYVGLQYGIMLRKIDADGIITNIVGGTSAVSTIAGDGGPVAGAGLTPITSLTFAADGSLLVGQQGVSGWFPPGLDSPVRLGPSYWNPTTSKLVSVTGQYDVAWSNNTWTRRDRSIPSASVALAPHPSAQQVVAYDIVETLTPARFSRTFRLVDGAWTLDVAAPGPGPSSSARFAVYDPGRGVPVLVGGGTYALGATDWELIADLQAGPTAIVYDPALPGLLMDSGELLTLGPDDTDWESAGYTSSVIGAPTILSFAYDASTDRMLALDYTAVLWERTAGVWQRVGFALTSIGYRLVADERRRSILVLPLDGTDTRVFEYRDRELVETEPLPVPVRGTATYDPVRGQVVIVGDHETMGYTFTLVRSYQ